MKAVDAAIAIINSLHPVAQVFAILGLTVLLVYALVCTFLLIMSKWMR